MGIVARLGRGGKGRATAGGAAARAEDKGERARTARNREKPCKDEEPAHCSSF